MKNYLYRSRRIWPLLLLFLLGTGLRSGRLLWQPLWADEGYSVYFATESLGRMVWLTANDIHPPLYYTLLHWWVAALATPGELPFRVFSLLVALPALPLIARLTAILFPGRRGLMLGAVLLLAVNPLHIFYSQELRMYGLAMTLSLSATIAFVRYFMRPAAPRYWWFAYIALAAASLHTLYYCSFLIFAHFLWGIWCAWRQRQGMRTLWATYLLIALFYTPWVYYTAANLLAYVDDKVGADQDQPLAILAYLGRHLIAFFAGHLTLPNWPSYWPWAAFVALLVLACTALWARIQNQRVSSPRDALSVEFNDAIPFLWWVLLFPTAIGFVMNRSFPFFPDGGERLLLFLLPYAILIVSVGIDRQWRRPLGKVIFLLLLLTAMAGDLTFYTLPRHRADDYRPLIRQVIQQGRDEDTFLAIFPWQVGLWRVYAPKMGLSPTAGDGPQVELVSERTVVWDAPLRELLTKTVATGALWFPGLRSIGSTLPATIDRFFAELPPQERPVLLVDSWYGNTTLRAWRQLTPPAMSDQIVDWGAVRLLAAGVEPATVAAANVPLRIDLSWDSHTAMHYGMTVRLVGEGRQWANHDYAAITELAGIIVPVGLPPGSYAVELGLVDDRGEVVPPLDASIGHTLASLAELTITVPEQRLSPARLPIQTRLTASTAMDGLVLLGFSAPEGLPLAGESLAVTLFWQSHVDAPPLRHLYISLLDQSGNGVAGWEGWPLATYPTTALTAGALVQTPVEFALPPTVASGVYQLGAGLLDPTVGAKSALVHLGTQSIQQRPINYTPQQPPLPLTPPVQFGTHALLTGYGITLNGDSATVQLYWQILQPLLPPHQLFIHLNDSAGVTVAQRDETPKTADGAAPTGSWLAGEYLVTEQTIHLPLVVDETPSSWTLALGLYLPSTGQRLPTEVNGVIRGDHVTLPLMP